MGVELSAVHDALKRKLWGVHPSKLPDLPEEPVTVLRVTAREVAAGLLQALEVFPTESLMLRMHTGDALQLAACLEVVFVVGHPARALAADLRADARGGGVQSVRCVIMREHAEQLAQALLLAADKGIDDGAAALPE